MWSFGVKWIQVGCLLTLSGFWSESTAQLTPSRAFHAGGAGGADVSPYPLFVPRQLIISFRGDAQEKDVDLIRLENDLDLLERLNDDPIQILVALLTQTTELDRHIQVIQTNHAVDFAEPNYYVYTAAEPNDPEFPNLWALRGEDEGIRLVEAWDMTTGADDGTIIVAVLDTGVDYGHEDLAANMWVNPGEDLNGNGIVDPGEINGKDDDGNGFVDDFHGADVLSNTGDPMDDNGHGTHVAGIIGAVGNNGIGVVGINWKVRIVACKCMDAGGVGSVVTAVKCLKYLYRLRSTYARNVVATSNSWVTSGYSRTLRSALARLPALHACAAGNDSIDVDATPRYPASYDLENIVTVTATDSRDLYTTFASFGPSAVDVAAPGVGILSTVPTGACGFCDETGYNTLGGTSLAAAHAAGAAALLWSAFPDLSTSEVKERMLAAADFIGDQGENAQRPTLTNGRLNVVKMLTNDTSPPASVQDLEISGRSLTSVTLTWTATGDDRFSGTASVYDVRYALAPITAASWAQATRAVVDRPPKASGLPETLTVLALQPETAYHFALVVKDDVGNESPLSDVIPGATKAGVHAFADDVETGPGEWSVTGLWHLSGRRSSSPGTSWRYGVERTPTYDTGAANTGYLLSPPIDLANTTEAVLRFDEWSQLEGSTEFDRTPVQVSRDGNDWEDVFESHGTGDRWVRRTVDLRKYAGGVIQIRFLFDTGDERNNEFEGWYVDDVEVVVNPRLEIATEKLISGTEGLDYHQGLLASGGTPGYSWELASGSLPPGLALTREGEIHGVPTSLGTFEFDVAVADSSVPPVLDTRTLSIVINRRSLALTEVMVRPTTPRRGTHVAVEVEVVNDGTKMELIDVVLTDVTEAPAVDIGSEPVVLEAGEATRVTFRWSTAGAALGEHWLEVAAGHCPDGPVCRTEELAFQVRKRRSSGSGCSSLVAPGSPLGPKDVLGYLLPFFLIAICFVLRMLIRRERRPLKALASPGRSPPGCLRWPRSPRRRASARE